MDTTPSAPKRPILRLKFPPPNITKIIPERVVIPVAPKPKPTPTPLPPIAAPLPPAFKAKSPRRPKGGYKTDGDVCTPLQNAADDKAAKLAARLLAEQQLHREAQARRAAAFRAAIGTLQTHAPLVFDPHRPKPMRIGMIADVRAALGTGSKFANQLMVWWVRKLAYQRALAQGGPRYALDGSPDGEVTPEQQETARAEIARVEAKRDAANGKGNQS